MANYYTDIPELKFHLNNPMMKRICELKERNYRDKDEFDYAPLDFEDAVDSYDKVLEITGEITGEMPVGIRTLGNADIPYWPQTNNACYKEVWVTSAGKWLSLIAEY